VWQIGQPWLMRVVGDREGEVQDRAMRHYRFSGVAGVALGRLIAKYDLDHALQPVD
jgi:hypothetical protein